MNESFHIVTLGCSKNEVDSQGIARLLTEQGMTRAARPEDARVLIVNTCGFLAASRQESVNAINELLARRRPDQVVIAAGCMAALGEHRQEIPAGVDAILSTREWANIGHVVGRLLGYEDGPPPPPYDPAGMLTTFARRDAGPSAYVKIADGCDHGCHFCVIPLIKGRQVSKRPSDVVREIRELVDGGTKEIVLVAQDTIRYGADLGIKHGLPGLLRLIAEQVPELPWLRMLYIYPSPLTLRLVDTMAELPMCVPYLDMPIQHADPTVLRRMGRPSSIDMTRRLIEHARTRLPEVVMRTTLIVGYPGETEEQFRRLYDFVAEVEFDHVGVFTYSYEPNTPSARLSDPVPPAVAEERRAAIMELQQRISLKKNQALVGRTLDVLIEAVGELEDERGHTEPISVGRARRHAPEVDGLVFIPGAWPVGELLPVTVTAASPYDLWARPARRSADGRDRHRGQAIPLRVESRPGRRARRAPAASARPAGT
ncbi:MAG: 30S ribosomal protein S12 methylthiotransferase RimO [Sphaerobacter sp.]|nr:30S ribosomal protein S12 methylthiotransferase RimO [Sphaerobacter sp.]